ncbi:hypothetical protein N7510_006125 [Penicillium lagena]|uniref:uncharacterized protein n=1 Tax=Penicillium lagena TaxID=94218 RepID=UPI00253F6A49|nr:uncharacterized protein N7510_006125 [Penicillium lagena]KAJ5612931.1 hypothetical protein N7510_006125 [Penicillium lagena]
MGKLSRSGYMEHETIYLPAALVPTAERPRIPRNILDSLIKSRRQMKVFWETIHRDLSDGICNRGASNAFIPYLRLQKVWTGRRLNDFVDALRLGLDDGQIETVRETLLRIISILIYIHWDKWRKFREIFFDNPRALYRRDENIAKFTLDELEHESFLGPYWAETFLIYRWIFYPVELTEGQVQSCTKEKRLIWCGNEGGDCSWAHDVAVARKRFVRGGYQREINKLALIRESRSTHERIVQELATVVVGHEVNILLPLAQMDLEVFLAGGYKDMDARCGLDDLICEAKELAGALVFLHNGLQTNRPRQQAVCHLDLKPKNILVFKDPHSPGTGVWKISDFGIARSAQPVSGAMTGIEGVTGLRFMVSPPNEVHRGPYQGPESTSTIGLKSDIWSLGCILCRVFAFGFGPDVLQTLDDLRGRSKDGGCFNDDWFYRGDPPILNPHVEEWIGSLPDKYSNCYRRDFLVAIGDLLFSMLEIDINKRPSATRVQDKLSKLQDLASSLGSHYAVPHPPLTPPSSESVSELTTRSSSSPPIVLDIGFLVTFIESGDIKRVETCLQGDVDVEATHNGERPLIHAINQQNPSIIQLLRNYRRNLDVESPSSNQQTPLMLAIHQGNADVVSALLEAKPSLDKLSAEGLTPLMEAALLGYPDIVTALLKAKAPYNKLSKRDGFNCLHYAVHNDTCGGELILAFKGYADFNVQSPSNETPLMMHARYFGRFFRNEGRWRSKLAALVDCGAEINQEICCGISRTVLEQAVRGENVLLAQELVDQGAILPTAFSTKGLSRQMKSVVREAQTQGFRAR